MNFNLVLVISLFVILSACGTHTVMNDFVSVNRNLYFEQSKIKYEDHFDFENDLIEENLSDRNYKMIYFPIITNLKKIEETSTNYRSNYGSSPGHYDPNNPTPNNSNNMYEEEHVERTEYGTADFFIIFENDKYLMSGFEYQIELLGNDKIVDVFTKLKEIKED